MKREASCTCQQVSRLRVPTGRKERRERERDRRNEGGEEGERYKKGSGNKGGRETNASKAPDLCWPLC